MQMLPAKQRLCFGNILREGFCSVGCSCWDCARNMSKGECDCGRWGISTQIGHYDLAAHQLAPALVEDSELTGSFTKIRTRLNRFKVEEQGHLINWCTRWRMPQCGAIS